MRSSADGVARSWRIAGLGRLLELPALESALRKIIIFFINILQTPTFPPKNTFVLSFTSLSLATPETDQTQKTEAHQARNTFF